MLTEAEIKAVHMAGSLAAFIEAEVIGHGPTRGQDVAELEALIHGVQRMVLAQAAARLRPGDFRLLGETLKGGEDDRPV